MADKTKNCGKGQLTSTDAKELYEAFMRNYEETMEEVGKQIDACLEETFQDRTSSTISDKEECFDEDAAYENYDVGEFEPIDRMEKERAEQYVGKFMANAGFTARYGRHVGISEDIHERVTKFVSIVGKGKISIASFMWITSSTNTSMPMQPKSRLHSMKVSSRIASDNKLRVRQ